MSLKFKRKLQKARKSISEAVDNAIESGKDAIESGKEAVNKALETDPLTLDEAKDQLIDDLEKGLQVFDEIDIPEETAEEIQEEIANIAIGKLESCFK